MHFITATPRFLFISSQAVRMMADLKELEEINGPLMASLKARDFSPSEITFWARLIREGSL
jgi:hypothetical protein